MKQIIFQSFIDAGFTTKQATKMMLFHKKNYKMPFKNVDIAKRISEFQSVFGKFGKTRENIIEKIVSFPTFFARQPETLENKIAEIAKYFNTSQSKFLNSIWDENINLISLNVSRIDDIVTKQAELLGVSKEEWKKCAFRRTRILTSPLDVIDEKIEKNIQQFNLTRSEWINAARRNPSILLLDPDNLWKRVQESSTIFQKPAEEIARAFLKFPQFFYMKPEPMRKKMAFITQMYLKDMFQMRDNGTKNLSLLHSYILNNLQLMHSIEALHKRCTYSRFLKYQGKAVRTAPMWRRKHDIETALADAPAEFMVRESKRIWFGITKCQINQEARQKIARIMSEQSRIKE